jgi:hypothetical protein
MADNYVMKALKKAETAVGKFLGTDKWEEGVEKNMNRWAKEVSAAKEVRKKKAKKKKKTETKTEEDK